MIQNFNLMILKQRDYNKVLVEGMKWEKWTSILPQKKKKIFERGLMRILEKKTLFHGCGDEKM